MGRDEEIDKRQKKESDVKRREINGRNTRAKMEIDDKKGRRRRRYWKRERERMKCTRKIKN